VLDRYPTAPTTRRVTIEHQHPLAKINESLCFGSRVSTSM
jgi:hypothetical protein